jgi:GTP-binding protein
VVTAGSTVYTIADVPGLIPGASEGRGLGLEFLRHVERCEVLVHVLDTATLEADRDPATDLDIIEAELRAYGGGLENRPRIVVLNKVDIPDGQDLADIIRPELEARGYQVFEASAVSRHGLKELSFALAEIVAQARAAKPVEEATRIVIRPKAVDDAGFTVTEEDGVYRVRGEKPERWVRQTEFSNDEAVGYLADRLNRLGVEAALAKAGARAGDEVAIGEEDNAVVFDWEPSLAAGAEMLGRRGEDHRFDAPRPAAQRRRDRDAERVDPQKEYDAFKAF